MVRNLARCELHFIYRLVLPRGEGGCGGGRLAAPAV